MVKTKSTQAGIKTTELTTTRTEARSQLNERILKGRAILDKIITNKEDLDHQRREKKKWNDYNTLLLNRIFTTQEYSDEYNQIYGFVIASHNASFSSEIAEFHENITDKINIIDSIIERLELIPEVNRAVEINDKNITQKRNNKVFIVHGKDEIAKVSLELFLKELGLDPIVLHRQPDQGMTILEKFEKHSDVSYAFILLTPDEVAYLAPEDVKPDSERKKEHRSRPNVIFEFGYFVGKLGRPNVCCIYTGGVSLPSNVDGMIYKPYKEETKELHYEIIKELKAAGFSLSV